MPPKRGRSADTAAMTAGTSKKPKTAKAPTPKKDGTKIASTKQKPKQTPKASAKQKAEPKKKTAPMAGSSKASSKSSRLLDQLHDPTWKDKLASCFETDKFKEMETWLNGEYKKKEVFPPKELIFNAFNITSFDQLKVVILGQDPYHDNGQAHGLSFSVPKGIPLPPSLKNIYKELVNDYPGFQMPDHGCLESWASQGVLMLNAALTVEAHQANSHARCGWWQFTDNVIKVISEEANHVVFLLWGGFAHKKESLIDSSKHSVIKTAHPSPLSFNKFKGCKCFSQVNDALVNHGDSPIDWNVLE